MSATSPALASWAGPILVTLLPVSQGEAEQILARVDSLSVEEASHDLQQLLGESPESKRFIKSYVEKRIEAPRDERESPPTKKAFPVVNDIKEPDRKSDAPPSYAPPAGPPPGQSSRVPNHRQHVNNLTKAADIRARDEQEMQQALQSLQYKYQIYNSDIDPEHDTEFACNCAIHRYKARKYARQGVQDMWSEAVLYPGEKVYHEDLYNLSMFTKNPYSFNVTSPYGYSGNSWLPQTPKPQYHAQTIHQTISLNNRLNRQAEHDITLKEPTASIWTDAPPEDALDRLSIGSAFATTEKKTDEKQQPARPALPISKESGTSKFSSFRKSIGIKTSEERAVSKSSKAYAQGRALRQAIEAEEQGRWPDPAWRQIVHEYQSKVGMTNKISSLRAHQPIQYFHLLKAGYFEPIPVAWATQASNPLKFSIEAAAGWRGITPAWRGYEDLAEERLYWVLNHREGSVGARMKPDFISELTMARDRMATAVEPPPMYYSANDTCHVQGKTAGYSRQVLPPPFHPFDKPENPNDDTMILLDVSGSMDFDPARPIYDQYLVTGFAPSTQPKNKDVAKAIVRRFTYAMSTHDHLFTGYDLLTFSEQGAHLGKVTHSNIDQTWSSIRFGGGTRVMTGWQQVKELHFRKHSLSAIHHPTYGWQAGPHTPILRLLLLLDGEATDMDEFELDLLGLSWAHVTIFLIGVDGCPHHHRHANELQRISNVNHHVSFVDAQGNFPERFVTHELLKRHLGYDIGIEEFRGMEELPEYSA